MKCATGPEVRHYALKLLAVSGEVFTAGSAVSILTIFIFWLLR